jgi:hypothetical protein
VKVSTLAAKFGLPAGSTHADCLVAVEQLKRRRSRVEKAAAVTQMEARLGLASNENLERYLLAQEIGPDIFSLNGEVLTGAELEAEMRRQYEVEHAFDDVTQDSRLTGEAIDRAAVALGVQRARRVGPGGERQSGHERGQSQRDPSHL